MVIGNPMPRQVSNACFREVSKTNSEEKMRTIRFVLFLAFFGSLQALVAVGSVFIGADPKIARWYFVGGIFVAVLMYPFLRAAHKRQRELALLQPNIRDLMEKFDRKQAARRQ